MFRKIIYHQFILRDFRCPFSQIIHSAVKSHCSQTESRRNNFHHFSVFRIRADDRILAGKLRSGGISDQRHSVHIKAIDIRFFTDPLHYKIQIKDRSREFKLRRQMIVKADYCKASPRQIDAVKLILLRTSVYISASVDIYNDRQFSL